ncbi:hypothetical protein [Rufibacter psychrotolerans]|uniref:hypothetical protein n=1 Tax=Rufibacter psychrotolerans TaxID=2812556 RepID=UPI00196771CE|nr:hypothetical protein [Rufibacter sp. SYSU D00308]
MTEKDLADSKDKILECISNKNSLTVSAISEMTGIQFDTVFSLTGELTKADLISSLNATSKAGTEKILTITPEGRHFKKVNSYAKLYEQNLLEKKEAKKKTRRDWLVQVISVTVALVGLAWGIYKDLQSDKKDQKIEQLEKEIKRLKNN